MNKLWRIQVQQDIKTSWQFFVIMRQLRKLHPEMNLFDRLDKATQQVTLGVASARLNYTLKHGSIENAPKKTEDA